MKSFNAKFEWELSSVLVALPLFTERLYRISSLFPLLVNKLSPFLLARTKILNSELSKNMIIKRLKPLKL